ncbi:MULTISPECIES: aldehyde dehydrogenase family protein [unclassified Rhodococcus (in: high G+C Gram-positive bacteria)]|jgi:acyl-CoA reductase-like NAD-dependent aldehyde dehydrogenase|uniref:aldehyde dehydrogenase family protein n=1 Tax=unclassified Rhodococcus (in: high G+C Gram-positive bacteria) TaxID=192944 RepID=UPI00035CD6F0|nr:aldehyde dehydrogenase family protein [Rhodococcus sp. DK17]
MTAETTEQAVSTGPSEGRSMIEVRCPADGRLVGRVPDLGAAGVASAAKQLREAQPEWEAIGPDGRAKHMRKFLDWILDNEANLIGIMQEETGKSWGDASLEIAMAVDLINYYSGHAAEFLADRKVRSWGAAGMTKRLRVFARPYQLVGMITPWNGPLGGPMLDGVAALMAGATVLFKPSEVTPLTWAEASRGWLEDIGAPPVLANITGGAEAGAAVVDEVDMVMFTGSTRTGRKIAARAGERLIPCSLELGGKDPMIVLADADIDRASSAAAWGGMWNSGQICISVERVYVEAPVYDEFVSKVTEKVANLRQGMDPDCSFATDVGAMCTPAQIDIVESHVDDALAKGARVLTGGKRAETGQFFEPTVLVDVDHSMLCMRDETFGPTLPIMKVGDEREAVQLANDTPYGLSASVWTSDRRRADRISRQVEAGAVNQNNVMMSTFQMTIPMSGWKQSGVGSRSGGAPGMLKFCRQQSVVSERIKLKSEAHWYPYVPKKSRFQAKMVRFLGAHDWRRRLGRAPKR